MNFAIYNRTRSEVILKWHSSILFFCILFLMIFIGTLACLFTEYIKTTGHSKGNYSYAAAEKSAHIASTTDYHTDFRSQSTGLAEVPESWEATIQKNLSDMEYHIRYQQKEDAYQSPNRANNLRITYEPGKVSMVTRTDSLKKENWKLQLSTHSVIFDNTESYLPSAEAETEAKGDTIEFNHGGLFTEEYINNSEGIRQNFIIHRTPKENTRELRIKMLVSGLNALKVNPREIHFALKKGNDSWENKIIYKDLKVWDAAGTSLPASMEVNDHTLALVVNTQGAQFPITVDPISTTVSTQIESNQASAFFGIRLSSAGDVNGDGYSDVIVGASGYDNGQADEGAAFVYHGSSSGITTTLQTQLECNQASASFGRAIASAGDVNGDGYSDVIVGAYLYDNGQSDEGAAFVYHGSASGITTTVQTRMESNQISGNMGFGVAGAGNVNGDAYSDVIVGVWKYDNGQADEGAAFVYHGSSSGITTTIQRQLECNQASASMGINVAGAGDVNGDGYGDVIVGAESYDNGQADEGAAFVYHGSASGVTTTLQTQLECNVASSSLGTWVSTAGDVNGDGYSDVIVGATGYDNGQADEGAAFVFHGSASGITTTVQTQMESNQASAVMGVGVACAGDVNGDGYSDVIVGVYQYDNGQANEGAVFVYLGSSTGINSTISTWLESNVASATFGRSVASAGDVNGDGYSDVIVGASNYTNGQTNEGAAYVYLGSASGLSSSIATQVEKNQASSRMGICVASAGDVNGDGYGDVIVGADCYDNGQSDEGAAFVYHGSITGLSTTASTQLEANQTITYFGFQVSSAGDVNGDGYSDVIVGCDQYANGQALEGAAFVYHGSSSGISSTVSTQLELNQAGARFGISLSGAGDVNGDGYSDVIVGAWLYDNGQSNEGAAFVYHGSASGITTTIRTQLESNQASAQMGISVASAGDVNGDGYSDVIIGANLYDSGQSNEGAAFVYLGSVSGISAISGLLECNQASANMGSYNSVSAAGDVNGDGYGDVIVGAPLYDNGQADEGAAFVYHGSSSGISTTVSAQVESNQASANLGLCVASGGDVNGDGYSDVIAGAHLYDNGQADEGAVFVYLGSSSGIGTTASVQLESNEASANMGYSTSSAGDVNGDGYSDVIVGVRAYDNGQADEGAAFVYYGNNGAGKRDNLRLYNSDLSANISQSNVSNTTFGAGLYSRSFLGRAKGKLVWEVKQEGVPFSSGSDLTNSLSYTSQGSLTDLGTAGTELKNAITKPAGGIATKIRARMAYDKTTAITGQVYGRWVYMADYQAGKMGMSVTPLPVELVSFEAEPALAQVKLKWLTASETNNDYFTIEKSKNEKDWIFVTKVKGAGNSNSNLLYTTDDNEPYTGVSYYRLKQADYNGAFHYSAIVPVEFNIHSPISFNVYPTLSSGEFHFSFSGKKDKELLIVVQNMLGQEYYTKGFVLDNDIFVQSIDLSATLAPGIYIVVASSNESAFSKRIVIK